MVECYVCNISERMVLTDDGECSTSLHSSLVNSKTVIACEDGYYLESEGNCASCSTFGEMCSSCSIDGCVRCTYAMVDGICTKIAGCTTYEDSYCMECEKDETGRFKYINLTTLTCMERPSGCDQCCNSTSCTSCKDGYWFIDHQCVSTNGFNLHVFNSNEYCVEQVQGLCERCDDSTYIDHEKNLCTACGTNHCSECFNESYCLSCRENMVSEDGTCEYINKEGCSIQFKTGSGLGCVACKAGYYLDSRDC